MEPVSLPHIEPVRPIFGKEPFGDPLWSFEFKYDGFRGLLRINNGEAKFVSRQDKVLDQFASLAATLTLRLSRRVQNAIFDGELVTRDETHRPIFEDILHRRGAPIYVAFDLLWLNGEDLRRLPLSERRKMLGRIVPRKYPLMEQGYAVGGADGKKMFDFICENDLEGVVAKRLSDPYGTRTKWYKIKNPKYSQAVGRSDFFNSVRRRATR